MFIIGDYIARYCSVSSWLFLFLFFDASDVFL